MFILTRLKRKKSKEKKTKEEEETPEDKEITRKKGKKRPITQKKAHIHKTYLLYQFQV